MRKEGRIGRIVQVALAGVWALGCGTVASSDAIAAMIDLGDLGGGTSHGYAIDDAGQAVGESYLPDGSNHAFLYTGGKMVDLGTLGGKNSEPSAINSSGEIVGSSDRADGTGRAFIYVPSSDQPIAGRLLGDVNLDGKVDVRDGVTLLRSLVKLDTLDARQAANAEVTGDGRIDVQDVVAILRFITHLIARFPANQ